MLSLIKDLFTSTVQGVRRVKVESLPSSFEENTQFRFFEDISRLNAGAGVPATSQLVYKFTATNAVIVFLRQINIWEGGRKYLVYPADGNETFTGTFTDVSSQIYPTSAIVGPSGSIPATGVTVERAIGAGIFSTTSLPRNGTASLTDGNANRATSSYTANGDRGGVAAGQSFYLVFDHIGQANPTLGLFLIAFEELFQ